MSHTKQNLEEASIKDFKNNKEDLLSFRDYHAGYLDGAKWQKSNLWKDAQGYDLPETGREVIALQEFLRGTFKVVFAHRPNQKGWNGKSLSAGKVEHFESKTYDKGGWNMPNVKYWLDAPLPKGIE